jgi:hypothetical protein
MNISEIMYQELNHLLRRGKGGFKSVVKFLKFAFFPLLILTWATGSQAITAPATGTFAYDLYDVAVNEMIKGPVGFVGGMIAVIVSAVNITKNWLLAGGGILGGTALIKADSITASLGAVV